MRKYQIMVNTMMKMKYDVMDSDRASTWAG